VSDEELIKSIEGLSFRYIDLSSMEIVKNEEGIDRLTKIYKAIEKNIEKILLSEENHRC